MKKLILSLVATGLALASAHAVTIVDIGGSTAGRTAVHNNIISVLTSGGNYTFAYDGTSGSPAKATHAIYHGTYNSLPIIIRAFWSGSVNGITPITAGTQQANFIDTSVTGTAGGQFIASPTLAAASAETVQEIGYSDVFASTVGATATDVEDETGIITFKWYVNKGTTGINNVTPGQVRFIYGASEAPKSLFTGNPADTALVYPIGRDASSGTRATALADSGYGNVVAVDQMFAATSNGTITGVSAAGNGGYTSGSSVKTRIDATFASGVLLGYLGAADFTANGVELTWNGVAYSTANIENGSYSFWGYLHMNRMNTLSGDSLGFYNALKLSIETDPQDTGVLNIGNMNVARDADGGPIYPF